MRFENWLLFGGLVGGVVVACGGSVSLGEIGNDPARVTAEDGGGSDGGTTAKTCASVDACGPAPGMPAVKCADGSTGGNTGRCLQNANGTCSWEIRTCPPVPACFDTGGNLDPSMKKCATNADCVVVDYQADCCGSTRSTGVAKTSEERAKLCADERAKGFPQCDCMTKPTTADDGSIDGGTTKVGVTCNTAGLCETSFKGTVCGKNTCSSSQTCCEGIPFTEPTCVNGTMCPISQRKHKKDINYLGEDDRRRLADELTRFPLATYRYKSETETDRPHLGFIIDDVAPSPAVVASGERVDMYGYQTMTVATLQVQAREIAALQKRLEELEKRCAPAKPKKP